VLNAKKIPLVCYCHVGFSGAILYVGSEFQVIGALSGKQAAKILKEGAKPDTIPVAMQDDLKILVDLKTAKKLGIDLPLSILQIAKEVDSERK
jgi:putative ABC transport system substrate-binding protein